MPLQGGDAGQKPLPCGCVRHGRKCAEAKRLERKAMITWYAFRDKKGSYDDFRVAQLAFIAHREGK